MRGGGRVKYDCESWAQDSASQALECEGGSQTVGSHKDGITRGSVAKDSFLLRGKVSSSLKAKARKLRPP